MRINFPKWLLPAASRFTVKRWMGESGKAQKALEVKTMNNRMRDIKFGLRGGPVFERAVELTKMLSEGKKLPFNELQYCNLGDPKAVGNKPITFYRQVIAAVAHPPLLRTRLPPDVRERAEKILSEMKGNDAGAYSSSNGIDWVREEMANMLSERDGKKPRIEDIYIANGASTIIRTMIAAFANEEQDKPAGICIPIPMYPLYTASIEEYGLKAVNYHLKEEDNWGVDLERLSDALCAAKKCCYPRALVVINPGNPTAQVLKEESMKEIIKFAHKQRLVLLADEVYWRNILDSGSEFRAFRNVANKMGEPYNKMEIATFMSSSKGWAGDCGLRGGVMLMENMDPEMQKNLQNVISAEMCSNTLGQVLVNVDMNPPKSCDPSYELYAYERDKFMCEMTAKARMMEEAMSKMEGFTLNPIQGAMYAFPKIDLPPKLVEEAKKKNIHPDEMYTLDILNLSGICFVPGSCFGQEEGTYHIRTTILPTIDKFPRLMECFQKAHQDVLKQYSK